MSRASWGGQQDLSGLFSSLINEDFQQIKAGVDEAVGRAQDEQAANDQKMQAKWTAGKISDERWLDYIRSRIADSTDPQERSQWQQILLQNQDAISDAQWETRFQQNKVTVGQLLAHYKTRMGDVRTNSPAYRDLVSRRTELLQFQRSGGVYYRDQFSSGGSGGGSGSRSGGSGGGSGSGGGGNSGGLQALITKGLKGGKIDAGYLGGDIYNDRGPNVVGVQFGKPATASKSSMFVAVADGLLGSQKMLDGLFDFIKNNPRATAYTIPGSGQIIPINAKTVRAAEDQWLRVTTTLVNVYHKKGDISEANYQETLIGNHVTVTMRDNNARFNAPEDESLGLWIKRTFARLNQASTPEERMRIANESGGMLDKYIQRHYPTQTSEVGGFAGGEPTMVGQPTTLEDQLPEANYKSYSTLGMVFDIIAHPDAYSDEEISAAFDDAQNVQDIGVGAGKIHVADLFGGNTESTSTIGAGSLGAGDFRLQYLGLRATNMLENGSITPDDIPPGMDLYTYVWNSKDHKMEPAVAVAAPQPDGSYDVLPGQVDGNGNVTAAPNAVKYVASVNGKQVNVFTPIINSPPASGYIYRLGEDMTLTVNGKRVDMKAGDMVPSSALESLGQFGTNAYLQSGKFIKDAPPGMAQADIGGRTWYFDLRTNTWYAQNPWQIEADKTDPNAIFVTDPPLLQNPAGGYSVNKALLQGPSTYITMDLKEGSEGYVIPFDPSMTPKQMQAYVDGLVASGEIDPGEYKFVDAEGNVVSMTPEQLARSYYDPVAEARVQTLRQTQINNKGFLVGTDYKPPTDAELIQQAKQDMSIRQWEQAQRPLLQDPKQQAVPVDTDARMRTLQQQAATLGIRTGVLPSNAPTVTSPADRRVDDHLLRMSALLAAQNRERISREPRLEPLPPNPKSPKPKVNPLHDAFVNKPQPIDLVGVTPSRKRRRNRSAEEIFHDTKADQMTARGIF